MNRLPTARYPEYANAVRWGGQVAENIRDLAANFPNSKITAAEMIANAIFNFACSTLEQQAGADRTAITTGRPCPSCGSEATMTAGNSSGGKDA